MKRNRMLLFAFCAIVVTAVLTSYLVPTIFLKIAESRLDRDIIPDPSRIEQLTPPSPDFYSALDMIDKAARYPFFGEKARRMGSGKITAYDLAFVLYCQKTRMNLRDSANAITEKRMAEIGNKIDALKNTPGKEQELKNLEIEYGKAVTGTDEILDQLFADKVNSLQLCGQWSTFFAFMKTKGMQPAYKSDPVFERICQ